MYKRNREFASSTINALFPFLVHHDLLEQTCKQKNHMIKS